MVGSHGPHQSRAGGDEEHHKRIEHVGVQSADLENAQTLGARANLQTQGATEDTISFASTAAVLAKAEPKHGSTGSIGSIGSQKAGQVDLGDC